MKLRSVLALAGLTSCAPVKPLPVQPGKGTTAEQARAAAAECLACENPNFQPTASALTPATSTPSKKSLKNRLVTESNVQPGFAEALQGVDGFRWLGRLSGNGGREVGIFIPQGVDLSKPVEIIYHFHGCSGHRIEEVGAIRLRQVLEATQRMVKGNRNVMVVYPLSAGKPPGKDMKDYDPDWMRTGNKTRDDIVRLHAEVLALLKPLFGQKMSVESITVKGHSAGGKAMVNVAESGFRVDRFDFLDSSYGERGPWCYQAARKTNPTTEFNFFVVADSPTDNRYTRSLEGKPGVRIIRTKSVPHKRMNGAFFGWQP